jgi:hypothetical protein
MKQVAVLGRREPPKFDFFRFESKRSSKRQDMNMNAPPKHEADVLERRRVQRRPQCRGEQRRGNLLQRGRAGRRIEQALLKLQQIGDVGSPVPDTRKY